ncbi:leucine--tRNA ligase [Candidatus Woesearchaeota archaeon]|nr:leucine--tRNA ligase [Candidatus Woesearchaeota archaeon]
MEFNKISEKWQKKWEAEEIFKTTEDKKKEKCYVLEMFPYPSSDGLHMGHAFNYTIGDIYARFKRMGGFNVLYPMGFDASGLPAENAAIKANKHPKEFITKAIKNYIKQMKDLGLSYDWSRTLKTCDPNYYRWNQFIFLKFLEKGLAYKKKSAVNWCPECKTVLANEQVHDGKCWRHESTDVELKQLNQWFIKTTDYADELLDKIDDLDWPDRIKSMQKNWIGKSYGTEINFEINGKTWPIFTTRPDTVFGVTFMVVSAQHQELDSLVTEEQREEVDRFLKKIKSVSEKEMMLIEKEGVFTGSYAVHPLTQEKVPVYVGNFVLADYGTGMVMSVPAHDQRDFDFAKKYKIEMKEVISSKNQELTQAYKGEGKLINSEEFNGTESKEAKDKITQLLQKNKLGKKTTQLKFKDWLVSRQRYWGTPIPVINCESCGQVPVSEKDLPIELPYDVKFGEGNPLETNKEFTDVPCPKCNWDAKRETDTMDTFFDSSWYYLRYCDPNAKEMFNQKAVDYWMPADFYIGGAEHACMHLIYARFFTKALRDLGMLSFDEPFTKLFNQGMLHAQGGEKMSKSKGNVVLPEVISKKYGVDSARFFLVSLAAPDKARDWDEKGIDSTFKFLNRVHEYSKTVKVGKSTPRTEHRVNRAIEQIEEDIQSFNYHTATIKLRTLFDKLESQISKKDLESVIKLFAPFCPHLAEEFWEIIGNKPFISLESWPKVNKSKINEKFDKEEEFTDKAVSDIINILNLIKTETKKVYLYVLPNDLEFYNIENISRRTNKEIAIYKVNDKDKYDPENKSKKSKPGKPAIFIE